MQSKIESTNQAEYETDAKKAIMAGLVRSDGFEQYLQKKYSSEKRFGVDGCEVLIPGINAMLDRVHIPSHASLPPR